MYGKNGREGWKKKGGGGKRVEGKGEGGKGGVASGVPPRQIPGYAYVMKDRYYER